MKGYRFRNLREDNDLKQRDVAAYLKIAERTYSGYENGTRSMPVELIIALAHFYKTSVDYILGITDDARPYQRNDKN